jgi:hypothetical protein
MPNAAKPPRKELEAHADRYLRDMRRHAGQIPEIAFLN